VIMSIMVLFIVVMCLSSGIKSIIFFWHNGGDKRSYYVFWKGVVIIYVGLIYTVVLVDRLWNFHLYPVNETSWVTQSLRLAAVLASIIFFTDSWIRTRMK